MSEDKKPDGRPAFPCAAFSPMGDEIYQYGITARQWFAGMALQGVLANSFIMEILSEEADKANLTGDIRADVEYKIISSICYRQADAMIAEGEK